MWSCHQCIPSFFHLISATEQASPDLSNAELAFLIKANRNSIYMALTFPEVFSCLAAVVNLATSASVSLIALVTALNESVCPHEGFTSSCLRFKRPSITPPVGCFQMDFVQIAEGPAKHPILTRRKSDHVPVSIAILLKT